jgi:tRNA dimethylallyltransferase
MKKLLIICGLTATGKTQLGVNLAKKYSGEIVSADSRQVYKGMDIVTGKDLDKNSTLNQNKYGSGLPCTDLRSGTGAKLNIKSEKISIGYRETDGIPVWLVDIVEPNYPFNVGDYHRLAKLVIKDIWERNKLPIVVGGTGLYIKSIIDPMEDILIPTNNKLRRSLQGADIDTLRQFLIKSDKLKWENMNLSDKGNPRRIIRAIEKALWKKDHQNQPFDLILSSKDKILFIGLNTSKKILFRKIDERVEKRIKEGAVDETKKLKEKGYSWSLRSMSASGYSALRDYIEGKEELIGAKRRWKLYEYQYVRQQSIWFKKEKRILWFDISKPDYTGRIEETVEKWYTAI